MDNRSGSDQSSSLPNRSNLRKKMRHMFISRLAAEPGTDRSFEKLVNLSGDVDAHWHCAQDLRPQAPTLRLRFASGSR